MRVDCRRPERDSGEGIAMADPLPQSSCKTAHLTNSSPAPASPSRRVWRYSRWRAPRSTLPMTSEQTSMKHPTTVSAVPTWTDSSSAYSLPSVNGTSTPISNFRCPNGVPDLRGGKGVRGFLQRNVGVVLVYLAATILVLSALFSY